jgi:glycosyltransferase involved in cell wall biosynthesis
MDGTIGQPTAPITVILPVYNGARDLGRALQSLAAQTVAPAEVIVIDDGSSDDSGDIARRAGHTVLRQANGGAPSAINAGIAIAKEPWLAFLCHDDTWHPRKIELQMQLIEAAPSLDLVFTDFDDVEADGAMLQRNHMRSLWNYAMLHKTQVGECSYLCDPQTLAEAFPWGGFILLATVVIRRSFVAAVGGLDEHIPFGGSDDTEFILRCLKSAQSGVVESPLYTVYHHPGQISADHVRMERINVAVVERVIERPENYHPASIGGLREVFRRMCLRLAWRDLRAGQYEDARRLFGKGLSIGDPLAMAPAVARFALGLMLESSPAPVRRAVQAIRRQLTGRRAHRSATEE